MADTISETVALDYHNFAILSLCHHSQKTISFILVRARVCGGGGGRGLLAFFNLLFVVVAFVCLFV